MIIFTRLLILPGILMVLAACQSTRVATTTPKLSQLLALKDTVVGDLTQTAPMSQLRLTSIKQVAYQWSVQAGMFDRYQQIQLMLESHAGQLDTIFSFDKFLIDGKILLPTILQTERIFEQNSDTQVRTINVSYTLDKPSRLVPGPPSWRQYLTRPVEEVIRPHQVMFPRSAEETRVWETELTRGWAAGTQQADDIFAMDFLRLQTDIEGMYRYRKLLTQHIVTLPAIKASHYSVQRTADGKTIHLNDVVYTLDKEAEFTSIDDWTPILRSAQGSNND
jgi:defect-in-organelle-trafficking protein DotC